MELWLLSLLSLLFLVYLVIYLLYIIKPTRIYSQKDTWQYELLRECPSIAHFFPAFLLINPHLQTFGVKFLRSAPKILYEREYIKMVDGGEVALDWDSEGIDFHPTNPTVIVMHGLVGSSTSKYIRNLVECLRLKGWRAVVFNARGCGTSLLKTPQIFHAGFTDDIRTAIRHIEDRFPNSPLLAAAYSLGANILTKYLGEEQDKTPIRGVVCISNPFDLASLSDIAKGSFSNKVYSRVLAKDLHKYVRRHQEVLKDWPMDVIFQTRNLNEFDQHVTIKMFNFPSLQEYYERSSSIHYLHQVSIPALFLSSTDDPVVDSKCIPYKKSKENPNLIFAITNRGGHTAFLKNMRWWKKAWSDCVIEEFLSAVLKAERNDPIISREEDSLLPR